MASPRSGNIIASVNNDLVTEILRWVDAKTLANAGCVCSEFRSITMQEPLWEEACCSLWASTQDGEVKYLISSLGGFKKFYGNCFPLIVCNEGLDVPTQWNSNWNELAMRSDGSPELHAGNVCPSDLVSIVDVQYKKKAMYSKVLWGMPGVDQGLSSNCPFTIDLVNEDDDSPTIADGLPSISCIQREKQDGIFWRDLWDNIRLSWILINRTTKQAVNLSSWSPVEGQRHWPSDKDFVLRFGSILPGRNILPGQVVPCIFVMKFRVSNDGGQTSLKMIKLSMQLEDMVGGHVNGRKSLLLLNSALGCSRSTDHNQVLYSYHHFLDVQGELMEEKMRSEGRQLEPLCVVFMAIAIFAMFCCYIL
eukprot:Gb_11568 [translate_table: standard]